MKCVGVERVSYKNKSGVLVEGSRVYLSEDIPVEHGVGERVSSEYISSRYVDFDTLCSCVGDQVVGFSYVKTYANNYACNGVLL